MARLRSIMLHFFFFFFLTHSASLRNLIKRSVHVCYIYIRPLVRAKLNPRVVVVVTNAAGDIVKPLEMENITEL